MQFKALAALAVAIGSVALVAPVAHAATGPAMSISASPVRVEIPPSPGKTVKEHYTLSAGAVSVMIYPSAMPFTMNSKGQTAPSTMPASVSGVHWLKLPKPFEIKAGQSKTVTVKINEPKHAQPGQRYVGILWTASPIHSATAKSGSSAHVIGTVGTELILDMPGVKTTTTTYTLSAPGFTWGRSINVTATAKDTGNSYVALNGQNVMVNGHQAHLNGMLLLGGTSQAQTIPASLSWGINHVTYNGQSVTVWAIPGEFLGLGLGFILLITGVVIVARRSGRNSVKRAGRHA